MIEAPYYPIVYLRGYAGSQGEIEATVSTSYTGFNLGSTRVRQLHTGGVLPYVFESPVIRLMKDHGYVDAYSDGQILPQGPTPSRSIWIFRYYDVADDEFGDGRRREIEFHARQLQRFLRHVRGAVLDEGEDPGRFRAYLVAHSMGGLICRCYSLNGRYPAERVFCLVGTDSRDYGAALGLSRHAAGSLSDGLVQIRNAVVRGAPRAFVHRSHSGHDGLVNSESGYQAGCPSEASGVSRATSASP